VAWARRKFQQQFYDRIAQACAIFFVGYAQYVVADAPVGCLACRQLQQMRQC